MLRMEPSSSEFNSWASCMSVMSGGGGVAVAFDVGGLQDLRADRKSGSVLDEDLRASRPLPLDSRFVRGMHGLIGAPAGTLKTHGAFWQRLFPDDPGLPRIWLFADARGELPIFTPFSPQIRRKSEAPVALGRDRGSLWVQRRLRRVTPEERSSAEPAVFLF